MRFRGGYNVLLKGRPDGAIKVMPEPKVLYMPLRSERFTFSDIHVKDGQKVNGGDSLAKDPDNYSVPMLAPRAGTVGQGSFLNRKLSEDVGTRGDRPGGR